MNIISSTEFRKDMAKYINESKKNNDPIFVTTQKQGSFVVIPIDEWESLQETQYLLKSPKNKKRLEWWHFAYGDRNWAAFYGCPILHDVVNL